MNRLLIKAPTTVTIDGAEYRINTDFRDCLHTVEIMRDPNFLPEEKLDILLNNMYLEDPPNVEEAIKQAIWFLRCGKVTEDEHKPALFDFSQDSEYIYSAFLKANVDLDCEDMHWWKFVSRFSELPESMFSRILYLRSQLQKRKLTKEEKRECEHIGWDVIYIQKPVNEAEDAAIQALFQTAGGEADV